MAKSVTHLHSISLDCAKKCHPVELDKFLTWACYELSLTITPLITKVDLVDISSTTVSSRQPKAVKSKDEYTAITKAVNHSHDRSPSPPSIYHDIIKITLLYNNNNEVIKIKFCKNKRISKCFLKVLSIALPFQTHLMGIQIDSGLKPELIVELAQVIAVSNITEVVLDNTNLTDASVYILLENTPLKHLSLSRCNVTDDMLEALASKLVYPLPASKSLCILNLTSNKITDAGAKYLGNALRSNRQLAYLNLLGNMIAEAGTDSILDSLKEFPVTTDELKAMKLRRLLYLRQEYDLKNKQLEEMDKKPSIVKRKAPKTVPVPSKKTKTKETNIDSARTNETADTGTSDTISFCTTEYLLGSFEDPFNSDNIITRDGITYCLGNNTLAYLSLAYNNLNYFNVKNLRNVLQIQNKLKRKPQGLTNVCIEGNNIPPCAELQEINFIIETGLKNLSKMAFVSRKKAGGKNTR